MPNFVGGRNICAQSTSMFNSKWTGDGVHVRFAVREPAELNAHSWPVGEEMRRQPAESIKSLHLGLLGDLQRIVNLNSEVAHRAFQLGVAEQQLHYPEILCSSVDQ